MKILMLDWDSFAQEYIVEAFQKAGYQVEVFPWPFGRQNMRNNKALKIELEKKLRGETYAFIFSLNFFPVASEACFCCGIKYISWVYDSPYLLLYSEHIKHETTTVYVFDKTLCRKLNDDGVTNVYYMPMAAPVEHYDNMDSGGGRHFQADVSFVGSLYTEENQNFYKKFEGINIYTRGYLEAIIQAQKNVYGAFMLEDLLNEAVTNELRRICPIMKGEDEWESDQWVYANYFLARRLTGIQREEILNLISNEHEVKLYAPVQTPELMKVQNCGPVNYTSQMPYVFKNSKINLNMTLRSIHSGIPLRAMDIMGCGGFLLTNYQEDFLDFFEPDVDYVYYTDNEDLLNKIDYYLSHDAQRGQIARNGHDKMLRGHTYDRRIGEILDRIKGEHI
ncbi:CgeB family protein [Kineothrix sedimenti]|uniref:Glycosyltransferase n=1 Tax=Kineothrix sedimenti TaxID=3123317 RepID=A0ABZ3F073_9FIRM